MINGFLVHSRSLAFVTLLSFLTSCKSTSNSSLQSSDKNRVILGGTGTGSKYFGPIELKEYEGRCGQVAAVNLIAACWVESCTKINVEPMEDDDTPGTRPDTLAKWMNKHLLCGLQGFSQDPVLLEQITAPALILGRTLHNDRLALHWVLASSIKIAANGFCEIEYLDDGGWKKKSCVTFKEQYGLRLKSLGFNLTENYFISIEQQKPRPDRFSFNRGSKSCWPETCRKECARFLKDQYEEGSCSFMIKTQQGPLLDQRFCRCKTKQGQTFQMNFFPEDGSQCPIP